MNVKTFWINLTSYSLVHFVVDFVSALVVFNLLFRGINSNLWIYLVILYNVLAFGTQVIFGHILDRVKKPREGAFISLILLILSVIFIEFTYIPIILVGLGNSLFHVCGGIISLSLTPKKATAPGIYVSLGAFGLFLGTLIGKIFSNIYLFSLPSICFSIILVYFSRPMKLDYDNAPHHEDARYTELIILLLLVVIVTRAFVGAVVVFPWKSKLYLAWLLVIFTVLGKAFGGILSDRIGWIKVSVGGLLLSAPLLVFANNFPFFAIVGICLFNFTMPVTLVALSNSIPNHLGFAFGLTTLALLLGVLPSLLEFTPFLSLWTLFSIILFSVGSLYLALTFLLNRKYKK